MRTKNTLIRNRYSLKQMLSLSLSIALTLVVIDQVPRQVSAKGITQSTLVVTPPATVPMPSGTLTAVNTTPDDQANAHVDRNRVAYTNDDLMGTSLIHWFDFATGTDNVVPGNGFDRLSDVADNRVVFSELVASGDEIVAFDTTSQTRTVISGFKCLNPHIGGNLVAFEDRNFTNPAQSEIDLYDFSSGSLTRLTNDTQFDRHAAVSPTGTAVVWEKCETDGGVGCDIYSAIQTAPGVFSTRALTGAAGDDRSPDTNGQLVVYSSTRGGETDIYYQPIDGGPETQVSIPGIQIDPHISGNLIVFDSAATSSYDIFVYDINSGRLYQVTNIPDASEQLGDISVWNGTGRIVFSAVGGGLFDIYAFTFQIPTSVSGDINDLIALVTGFNLPHGIENSLLTKLQSALAALNASDTATTCDALKSFINQSDAQSGKALTEEQARQLINAASQIRTTLGCQ